MDIVLGILCLFLIGIWVSTIINSRKPGKMKHLLAISKDTILMGMAINQKYGK